MSGRQASLIHSPFTTAGRCYCPLVGDCGAGARAPVSGPCTFGVAAGAGAPRYALLMALKILNAASTIASTPPAETIKLMLDFTAKVAILVSVLVALFDSISSLLVTLVSSLSSLMLLRSVASLAPFMSPDRLADSTLRSAISFFIPSPCSLNLSSAFLMDSISSTPCCDKTGGPAPASPDPIGTFAPAVVRKLGYPYSAFCMSARFAMTRGVCAPAAPQCSRKSAAALAAPAAAG